MSMQDLMSDFVARINNSVLSKNTTSEVLKNNIVLNTVKKLTKLGFFDSFDVLERTIIVTLKTSKISSIKRVSKPGRRIYSPYNKIPKLFGGHGFYILSTPSGIMTNIEAYNSKNGGEILFSIF